MTDEKNTALEWISRNQRRYIRISDTVWEFAEVGLIEFKSSALLADELEKQGFDVQRGIAGMPTAFVATWGTGNPVVGVMGEYDALPGMSQKRLPSKNPMEAGKAGHGCGHNIHGTSGLMAAVAVKKAMETHGIEGTIKFFGCPAEENFSGKVFMVREGFFKNIDAVISHHPNDMNAVNLRSSLALNSARFHFRGKASHAGASPEQGRSALDAVELMNVGVNFLREHISQDARVHYVIEKGGDQPNIVPAYARSWYYIRAPEREQLEFIYNWILDVAKGAAMMTRTEMKAEFLEGVHNLVPSRALAELVVKNMREIGLPEYGDKDLKFVREIARTIPKDTKASQMKKSMRPNWRELLDKLVDDEIPEPWGEGETMHGSTDVGDVSWQVPTLEFGTATWVLGTPAHSWQAVAQSGVGVGHKSLIFSAKTMAATALDLLLKKTYLKKAQSEHKQRTRGKKYKSPIPKEQKPPLNPWA